MPASLIDEILVFGSPSYLLMLGLLLFSRGCDFLSTWIATPNLVLEGNPLAKRLGWRLGMVVNLVLCLAFAFYPFTGLIICTTSLLVAARNFQNAWLMRLLGEDNYRDWFVARVLETHLGVYLFCLLAQTFLYALVGFGIIFFSRYEIPIAIGVGIVAYSITVLFYTLLSVWRIRR